MVELVVVVLEVEEVSEIDVVFEMDVLVVELLVVEEVKP